MLKTTLLAAAALSFMALGATQASAGYGYGYGYGGHGYGGHKYYKSYYPRCRYVRRPIKIKLWDDYSYSYYFKTVYRKVRICY